MLLEHLWKNKRKTRGRSREEKEGNKRYFDDRIDAEAVLKTWSAISRPDCDNQNEEMHEDEE